MGGESRLKVGASVDNDHWRIQGWAGAKKFPTVWRYQPIHISAQNVHHRPKRTLGGRT